MAIKLIDKKILRELGNNARQSYKEIAKKINSKKEIVAYHINKMEEKDIIIQYNTVFSQARLGIFAFKIYVRFQGLTQEKEDEMIKTFKDSPHVNWIAKSAGTWDLMLGFYCRNIIEFAKHKEKLLFKPYGKYIQYYTYSSLENVLIYSRDYLIKSKQRARPGLIYMGSITEETIDDDQKRIIKEIRIDGRYEAAALARKLGLNVKTVLSKIRDLEKRKIIQGHCVIINQEKLGVKYFKVQITFQDHTDSEYRKVLSYCKNNMYVVNLMISVGGGWEIELEAEAETVEEIYQLTKDLRTRFPTIIRKVDLHLITKEIKADYWPAWY